MQLNKEQHRLVEQLEFEVQQNFPIKTGETASLFLQHFIKILKAGGKAAADISAPKIQAITIDSEGKITLNLTPVSLDELESKISGMVATTPDLPVVVRGDSSTQYQKIMAVVTLLGKNGITKIGLATQPNK